MSLHTCEKCGKSFPCPSKLKRHNERKTPCVNLKNNQTEKGQNKQKNKNTNLKKDVVKINNLSIIDIDYFDLISSRGENDKINKVRENIICYLFNKKINKEWLENPKWKKLNKALNDFINLLKKEFNIEKIDKITCKNAGGRGNKHDYWVTINDKKIKVEFKFNATNVNECPQFCSPMKPSQYMSNNFEEYFYNNYLNKIAKFGKLTTPNKEIYLKKIHNNKVDCMNNFKVLYDNNKEFNKYCKRIDKEGIAKFIEKTDLKINILSDYLLDSQKGKIYMCYKDGKFYLNKLNENQFKLVKLTKKEKTNFICETAKGIKLEIRLRFKNGCGLQYPAFQIKRKIPIVKQLKELCKENNLKITKSMKKADILTLLDEKKIIY